MSGNTSGGNAIVIHKDERLSNFKCPVLKSTNYTVWAIQIKTILRANELWEMIEPKADTQPDEKKDMAATAFLFQALPEDMILQVASCKSAKDIWDALKTRNVGVDRVQKARLQTLKTEFEMLRMKEEDTIDMFSANLNSIVTRANGLGSTFDQPTLVRKLLSSVPKRFVQIVAIIEQFADLDTITLDETIGRLKAFEERTTLVEKDPVDNHGKLLFTRHDNMSGHEKRFGNRGQERSNSSQGNWHDGKARQEERGRNFPRGNFRNKDNNGGRKSYARDQNQFKRDMKNIECYNCHDFGHLARDCPKEKKAQEESNLIQEDDEPTLLMAVIEGNEDSNLDQQLGE